MTKGEDDARAVPTGRLAPSPTGSLHLGHARSFLLGWWHARSRGGRLILRLEDIDRERVKPGMADQCLRDLEWLGLDWDGPVWVQSQDARAHAAALQKLIDAELAYPCVCSRKEIEAAQSAPHADEPKGRYPGTCRGKYASVEEAERKSGRSAALRFRTRTGGVVVDDAFAGRYESDVEREVGDFPIALRAGSLAYQLAVVVDDARASVDEVLRGDDLLASTPRQFLLQEALGVPHPTWYHVPLVVDEGGRRLAKRSDDLSLARLRSEGVEPRAIVAWVARRSGMLGAEMQTAHELATEFDIARVPRTPVVFREADIEELRQRSG